MSFDPIRTARVAASDYIATHGYAAYRSKIAGLGLPPFRDMDSDDALAFCKALGYGAMVASARAGDTTPKAKTTAQAMNDMAAELYGDKPEDDGEEGDVELNTHLPHDPKKPQFEGADAVIDPAAIYAHYNAPKKRGVAK